jgi:two-component sensor histidine kinase
MENKITPSLPELLLEEFTHRINNDIATLISELVENARKHAFGGAKGAISVELGVLEGSIQCRVSDNGRGYSGVNRGRGLMIVYALAASLNGNMSREHISGGTSWVLTMPY